MRAIADGEAEVNKAFADEMYYCLGCLACETACPAGVDYAHMFEDARAEIERVDAVGPGQRVFWRWLAVKTIFMHPRLLRLTGRMLWMYQVLGLQRLIRRSGLVKLLPKRLGELETQTPQIKKRFSLDLFKEREIAVGAERYTVGFLTGCIQDLAFSDVNADTVTVLKAAGCSVETPAYQGCCGSLHAHNGEPELARKLARGLIDLFPLERLDAVITNAGGCGSHLKHFGRLLADDPAYAERAHLWDQKCRDIHEWLDQIGFEVEPIAGTTETMTYHDSCHLCHGQGVKQQPRKLLRKLKGEQLVELPESDWCCGSAGIYNITQPEQAGKLLERKVANLKKTGASCVATANPGCHLQLENGLRGSGVSMEVKHPMTLLAESIRAGAIVSCRENLTTKK